MTFSSRVLGSIVLVFVAGCSGSTAGGDLSASSSSSSGGSSGSTTTPPSGGDAATLFDTPSGTVTPDTIFGLWGGVDDETAGTEIDVRVKLTTTSISNALRCTLTATQKTSGIVGVTVAARNTEDDLVFLESKNDSYDDGTVRCSTSIAPHDEQRCAADVQPGFEQNCFELAGTHLTLYGDNALAKLDLIKLSD